VSAPFLRLAAVVARAFPPPLRTALYRFGPVTRLVRRALNRAAPTGIVETVVAAGPLAGAHLLLDLQSEKDLWLGTYEPNLLGAIQALARPGVVAYDIGANIGYTAILLARCVGSQGKVVAFEPLPANLERLRANLALNSLETVVTVAPLAVGREARSASFLVHASGGMGKMEGSAGREAPYPERITVEAIDLDTYVYARGGPAPSLIKMDIEGGEVLALPGMRALLQRHRPTMLIELHGPEAFLAAQEILGEAHYRLHRVARGFPPLPPRDALGWKVYLAAFPEPSNG
jgi:FkbM family methyltransferase